MPESSSTAPIEFAAALASLRTAHTRDELRVSEIPAPSSLAPYAVAFAADVLPRDHSSDSEFGTGRFVLLYDPGEQQGWGGRFRIVCFAQAPLEPEIGLDPFLADVAWSWLTDSLDTGNADYDAISGTATKVLSSGYGELSSQPDGAQIELRASWTPMDTKFAAHVEAWSELLGMLAGLPPVTDGVSLLARKRAQRG